MWTRRSCLRLLAIGGGAFWLSGHAPYRQWLKYRSARLMIVASRHEPEAFPLAEALTGDLQRAIPDAKPEVARAGSALRIASLVVTRQIEVAVLTADQAGAMSRGEGESVPEGPVPLSVLGFLREPFVLVCHTDFDRDRAYLLTFAMFDNGGSAALSAESRALFQVLRRAAEMGVPLHSGAQEFYVEQQAAKSQG